MAIHGQEIGQGLPDCSVLSRGGFEIGDYQGFEQVFVFDDAAQHELAESSRAC